MTKKSTKKWALALCLCFLCSLSSQAKLVTFKLKDNPWKLPMAEFGDEADVAKLEDGFKIEQDGFVLTNKKNHDKNWNRIFEGYYTIYPKNEITITGPEGINIYRINFYAKNEYTFDLKSTDKGRFLDQEDDGGPENMFGFDYSGNVAHFQCRTSKTELREIAISYDGTPTGINKVAEAQIFPYDVFNLDGVKVGTTDTFNQLPKGIYIVNGRKQVKQ